MNDPQPMDPVRLTYIRADLEALESLSPGDGVCLLADRDRLAADARHLTEALCIVLGCEPGALALGDILRERLGDLGLGDARISAVVSSTLAAAAVKRGAAGS